MKKIFLITILSSLLLVSCTFEKAEPLSVECSTTMFYTSDIKPFIDSKCVICHNNGSFYLGAADFADFNILKAIIDNGSFKNRVFNLKDMAPATEVQLTKAEFAKLKCWLDQGALNN
jgi:hypothetical protein